MRSGVPSSPFFTRCASQTFSARVRGRASGVVVFGGAAFMRSLPQDLRSADDELRDGIGLERGPAAAPKEKSWSTHLFRLHRVQRRPIQSHGELAEQQGRPVGTSARAPGSSSRSSAVGRQHPRAVRRVQVGDHHATVDRPRRARASSTPSGPDRRARSGAASARAASATDRVRAPRVAGAAPRGRRARAPGARRGRAVGASCARRRAARARARGPRPGGASRAAAGTRGARAAGLAVECGGLGRRRDGISPGGGTMKSGDSTRPL